MAWIWIVFVILCQQNIEIEGAFSCEGRASGYYADVDAGCQVYHMCDGLGRQFSYSCPNTTLFQQRMLICDHWYMVNCSKSELDYNANLLIGQKDKPFVDDSSENPYHRTPRPDLETHPYAPQFATNYRQAKTQFGSPQNLVGVDTEEGTTDGPQYFLPSHWSTRYSAGTTPLPNVKKHSKIPADKGTAQRKIKNPQTNKPRFTLPPLIQSFQEAELSAPTENTNSVSLKVTRTTNEGVFQGFERATPRTPRLPSPYRGLIAPVSKPSDPAPDRDDEEPIYIKPDPGDNAGEILHPNFPPKQDETRRKPFKIPEGFGTPKPAVVVNKTEGVVNEIEPPSIFYQPPKLEPYVDPDTTTMDPIAFYKLIPSREVTRKEAEVRIGTTTSRSTTRQEATSTTSSDSEIKWKELRKIFFIPEYDFPLDLNSRPGYDSGLSSFQVNPIPATRQPKNAECDPKCDPAFLAPGTCKPCVTIRR